MTIDLDEREYRTLLELLFLAHWVVRAHEIEPQPDTQRYDEAEQAILSRAEAFGCEDAVEYSEEEKRYFPTKDFEESTDCFARIENFEDDTFWDELITRLAERDAMRELGPERFASMPVEERFEAMSSAEERYAVEFEANGLDNITIRQ